ncbi:hypothetical protein NECID01_0558 [Nematocida sp. AWRm77]|nr:hypothetical protein NECID01_0558 [Nematocida sp. AWRm77]
MQDTAELLYISAKQTIPNHHNNQAFIFETVPRAHTQMEKSREIVWYGKDVQIASETWEDTEDSSLSGTVKTLVSEGIFTPGPKAEPPFEVDVLFNLFFFKNGKESSVYVIKIASLCASWVVIKTIEDIVHLISRLKERTSLLSRLSVQNFLSISPDRQEERILLIKLILGTVLNDTLLQQHAQYFVLTNTVSLETIENLSVEEIVAQVQGNTDGVHLVEYKGWLTGWKCGFFQLRNHLLTRTSPISGKLKETIDIRQCHISIGGDTLRIQGPKKERSFVANDKKTIAVLKKWFFNHTQAL